ncbi:deoxyguanosinetriphosphate triphosphohydrolase [Ancylomarina longa]|uniref:Deoxyguanosinetriphosphate triphosphohydrolase n=1 Tax=Ancylomarina longa TaxID=2487017 RepID=A0A434AV95_9BACT|nr:deoxyguanosinetriphosphate triphosphohydrolase [Ancylomarina longa]RUT78397.1 deoxyguanosinetriphosphate triphosphohydrolase [Ancylomarina longa]
MNWKELLSTKRLGQEDRFSNGKLDVRTQFQRDYDRLIFSSPFRRLQNKTQVFPLPGSIFVHNRLTHSLEVSCVGRSLGNALAEKLVTNNLVEDNTGINEIGSIVAAACLAHDLGNPPFGHSGEKALSHFFENGKGKDLKSNFTDEEWADLTNFEGNANAFRLLTHAFHGRRKGGFAMTYSTIASILKYPWEAMQMGNVGKKKYGYFQSEKEDFEKIIAELGIPELSTGIYARFPLVYLVEAADDICYQIMDIEDAHKLQILSTEETKALFLQFYDAEKEQEELDKIQATCLEVTDTNEQIAFIRAGVIGKLAGECVRVFMDNYQDIMQGTFNGSLINKTEGICLQAYRKCTDVAVNKIYKHRSVIEIELAGYKILGALLEEFVNAVLQPDNYYAKNLLSLVPEQYLNKSDSKYRKVLSILDFISGMTDIYALDLYRKIKGIELPAIH